MELQFLDRAAIDDFLINFDMHKAHYQNEENGWFIDYWQKKGALRNSGIEIGDLDFSIDSEYTVTDRKNVIAIHSAMRNIPRSVVADERMWATLAHTKGWKFLKYRRASDILTGDSQRLKTIFFFSAGTRRSCYLNGIAKYWWCGETIYDPTNDKDPYAALDVICSLKYFTSLVLFMSSSNCTSNKDVVLGIIDAFSHLQQNNIPFTQDNWKELLGYMNKLGSTMILDSLSREDISSICLKHLLKVLKA